MVTLKIAWSIIVLSLCLAILFLCAGPHLYGILATNTLFTRAEAYARARVHRWQNRWFTVLWHVFRLCMCIKVRLHGSVGSGTYPALVVANHRSSMDLFMIPGALASIGHMKTLAVVKWQARRIPFIGRAGIITGCPFLKRDGSDDDILALKASASRAQEDGATLCILPEGTRGGSDEGWQEVRRPRTRGFTTLVESLPSRPVLSMTIDWHGVRSRTITDIVQLIGARIDVYIRRLDMSGVKPKIALQREWRRMDKELRANST